MQTGVLCQMRLSSPKLTFFRLGAFGPTPDVRDDTSDLISLRAERTDETAQLRCFQESIGVVLTGQPGHADRVARKIARRGPTTAERSADRMALDAGQRRGC